MSKEYAAGMREAAEIVKRLGTPPWSTGMDTRAKEAYEEIIRVAQERESA